MVKRGALVVAAMIVLAVAVGVIAGQRSEKTFSSSCLVRFSLPLTAGTGTNYFDVNQTVAINELDRALRASVYGQAATAIGADAGSLAAGTRIEPGPKGAFFTVTVTNAQSEPSRVEAGAVCAALREQLIR